MSNTHGGWNPQDGQSPQPVDPYGPRDPYGRPANPYGRPDYQPPQYPHGGFQQQQPVQQVPAYSPVQEPAPQPDQDPPTIGRAWRWAWGAFGTSWGTWVLMSLVPNAPHAQRQARPIVGGSWSGCDAGSWTGEYAGICWTGCCCWKPPYGYCAGW